jgi:hypothetical protein
MLAVVKCEGGEQSQKREIIDVLTDGYKLRNIWGSVGG